MLKEYLTGNDVILHVGGGNRDTTCYSLQVLDLVDVKVKVPAKIDNKPAFLREYSISPTLKELDSKTHKCLLELKVVIKINNPLPINFDLFGIELDLLYEKESDDNGVLSDDSNSTFLLHISDTKHVSWSSHEENSIVLDSAVHDFDTCMEVVGFYLHNQLAFDIEHGHIAMGAGSGNFSIPFSVKGIHIHPATIVYDKLLCPFLKEHEPLVDEKLLEAQDAAEGMLSSFLQTWGQTIADRVAAIKKSEEFTQVVEAIKSLTAPDSPKQKKLR
ncbi:hypothetical protein JM18_000220 [Phytophthora kernoviae]|uniref:Uncharacterized protein n=1 Tax=Phytophthora kernoviae TaxID=325452 RepID=A0A922AU99_9STRA|nr:hypothetical protein JM18_000220 [Phytophthora kernoviae]